MNGTEFQEKECLLLGILCLNYVKQEKTKILPMEKTSSGQQKYKCVNN